MQKGEIGMNYQTNYIYTLIILECRLSKSSAMRLFRMDESQINTFISHNSFADALNYLFNYESNTITF